MTKRESHIANLLLLTAMLLAGSYILMRSVGDTLFLARVGSDSLAAVFVLSGVATAALASIWFVLTRRLSLATTLRIWAVISAGLTLAAWYALPMFHHSWWLLASIYLLTEVKGAVNAMNIVSASNEAFDGHSSRRAWARFGLGAPLGAMLAGMLIGVEASFIDLRWWLLISAALDLVVLWPLARAADVALIGTIDTRTLTIRTASTWQGTRQRLALYADSSHFRWLVGLLIAAKIVVLTLISFSWKVSVNDYFGSDEQSLTRYFGILYAVIGALTLLVQAVVAGPLLSRRKLQVPLLLMPVSLFVLSVVISFGGGALFLLVILTVARSTEVWRRSVHDTTLSMLYTRIERGQRRAAISINTAIVKPAAEVSAALFLLLGPAAWRMPATLLSAAIWLLAVGALLRLLAGVRTRTKSQRSSVRVVTNRTACSEPV